MQEKVITAKDYLVSKKEFEIVWNPEYRCLQTSPVPHDLEAYYKSPEYVSHSDRAETLIEKIYQRAKRINLKRKLRIVEGLQKETGSLMDVGAGTGDFLKHAQMNGWEVYGVEPNDEARELSHQKGVSVYRSLAVQKHPAYDVITFWHVFEHLKDPDESIEEVSAALKPEGWLVIALPNYRSYDARFYKKYWAGYDVPRHVWHFSKDSIKHLFVSKGYEVVKVKPLWLDSFYVSWLSETYRGRMLAPLRGFVIGFLSNLFGIFSGEYSSHVYILRRTAKQDG